MKKMLLILFVMLLIFYSCDNGPVELASVERVNGVTSLVDDDPYSGQIQMHYTNGETKFVENIKEGRKDGEYLSYYKSGLKKIEGKYENGKRRGVWKWWDEKGEVNYQIDYSSNISFRF